MRRLTEKITNKNTKEVLSYRIKCQKDVAAIQKLGKLEDLEEQGKLLNLPCMVGDSIYKIWSCGKNGKSIAEFVIAHIDIDHLPQIEFSYCKKNIKYNCNYYFSNIEEIGKTIFLTKEEANKELQKLNKTEECNG